MTFTPLTAARNAERNRAKRGDTIVYRDPNTLLVESMLVESVLPASDKVNVVYLGSGRRQIHSRHVSAVR